LLKAQEDFVPPVKKKYNPVKNMNAQHHQGVSSTGHIF
jgi:hypothetical protein